MSILQYNNLSEQVILMLNGSLSENWFIELNTIKISFCEVGLVRHLKHKNKFYIQKSYSGPKKP